MERRSNGKKFVVVVTMLLLLCLPVTVFGSIDLDLTKDFFVNDYADVIRLDVRDEIVAGGQDLYDKTGVQLVIATVQGQNGYDMRTFAYNLFNEWQLGSTEENNGLLIVFAPYAILDDGLEGDYAYEIGAGLEDYISAGDIQQLCDDYLESYFVTGDYSAGAASIYEAVRAKIEREMPVLETYDAPQQGGATTNSTSSAVGSNNNRSSFNFGDFVVLLFAIVLVVLLIILSFLRPRRRRRYRTIYGVPYNPYSRRYVRRYGSGGYWGPHGRPMNPPPPRGRRYGRPHPGGGSSMMGSGSRTNKPNAPTGGSRPTAGGGGISRGTGGSRSTSGSRVSKPSSSITRGGSGLGGSRSSGGSRPRPSGGGMSRGSGGSRSSGGGRRK